MTLPAISRDFTYENDGVSLTYTVISETDRTCMTKAGNDYPQNAGNNVSGRIVIPATVSDGQFDYTVTKIGESSFIRCDGLVSVSLPVTVTEIDGWAFAYCDNLDEINLPSSLTKIASHAFFYCNLSSGIIIPGSVAEIGEAAFGSCGMLGNIKVAADNALFSSENGVLYNKDKTFIYQFPAGKAGEFVMPFSVRGMAESAFVGADKLTSVVISENITAIGRSAFHDCASLSAVVIPSSVTTVGMTAFAGCKSLQTVDIPANVSQIGRLAFSGCENLEKIMVDNANENFSSENGVLYNKDKTTLIVCPGGKTGRFDIPVTVQTIGYCSFYMNEKLTSVSFAGSELKTIEDVAFGLCKLDEIDCSEWSNPVSCPENVFSEDTYLNTKLLIPAWKAEKFAALAPWNKFSNIVLVQQDGIESTIAKPVVPHQSAIYTLGGVPVGKTTDALPAGVYIKVTGDTSSKVLVR